MPNEISDIAAALERNNAAVTARLEEVRGVAAGVAGRLGEVEQALARMHQGGGMMGTPPSSPTRTIMDAPEFAAFRDRRSDRASIPLSTRSLLALERRAVITSIVSGDAVAPSIAPADRSPNIAFGPQQSRWLFQLMPPLLATSGSIEYLRETTFTNNAASQASEGSAKAESSLAFTLVNEPIPTIAHWTKASRQALSDSAALQRHLETRLIYGLLIKLEAQMIVGDGTAGSMTGLTHAGNFTPYAGGDVGDTSIDTVRRAIGQLEGESFVPDVVVLNPDDWTAMELVKDTPGRYIAGNPKSVSAMNIWNRLVYTAPSMPAGQFVVGALAQSTSFYAREDAILRLSDSDSDNFTKNLVTALAELRSLMTVNVPAGIIYGDLTEVS